MNRSARRFLDRAKTEARRADREPAEEREHLRWTVDFCAGIREKLLRLGVDPAGVGCLAIGDDAAAALAAIPDTPELRRADAALLAAAEDDEEDDILIDGEDPREVLLSKIGRLVENWRSRGGTPDFARDPLMAVYGWCLAQGNPAAAGPETPEAAGAAAGGDSAGGALA